MEQEPSSELAALIFGTLDVDIFLSRVDRHNILVVKNWIEFAELVELVNYFLKILRFLTDPLFELLCLRILSDELIREAWPITAAISFVSLST